MRNKRKIENYEPVVRSPRHPRVVSQDGQALRSNLRVVEQAPTNPAVSAPTNFGPAAIVRGEITGVDGTRPAGKEETWVSRRGHAISFAGLFAFTFLVYFRPYELFPSLAWLSKSAFVVALITVAVFIPTQLGLENRITAKPREVKLVLALVITGILSIPLALEPSRAFQSFTEYLKVVVMFIVMVNVVRTEKRLKKLILLVLFASCVLSIGALNDYRLGNLALQGRRIAGVIGGLFSNPNDLALHLVTMIPISFALIARLSQSAEKEFVSGLLTSLNGRNGCDLFTGRVSGICLRHGFSGLEAGAAQSNGFRGRGINSCPGSNRGRSKRVSKPPGYYE